MTRETKIGLFVGMGVVILISILISDHLSEAQKQQHAIMSEALTDVPANRAHVGELAAPIETGSATLETPRVQPRPVVRPAQVDHIRLTQDLTKAMATEETRPQDNPQAGRPPGPQNVRTTQPALSTSGPRTTQDGPLSGDLWIDKVESKGEASRGANQPPVAQRIESNQQRHVHYVKEGESLSAIALQYYGDKHQWPTIFEANSSVLKKPEQIRPGVRLEIPNIAAKGSSAAPPKPTPAAPQYKTHTLAKGETLGAIAAKYLGTSRKWRDLQELNKDVIPNPNRIAIGTEIRIPLN